MGHCFVEAATPITAIKPKAHGFTLIEILLVIVIMTVLSAMVAPSFFQSTGTTVNDEARYMQKILRLAAEETQLTGRLVRASVYQDHLLFETPNNHGKWGPLLDGIFQANVPQAPVIVQSAHLNGDVGLVEETLRDGEKPPLARFSFWPDGRVSAGELVLSLKTGGTRRVIQLRSGPGGVHLLKESE
ncbi:MAG: type II secretion system protein [Mariprofundaceae bacterium]|nr:type II secretion system protein [Mariprofundaceae bacterium]